MADVVAPYEELEPIINARKQHAPVELLVLPKEQQVQHVSILKYLGENNYMNFVLNFLGNYN